MCRVMKVCLLGVSCVPVSSALRAPALRASVGCPGQFEKGALLCGGGDGGAADSLTLSDAETVAEVGGGGGSTLHHSTNPHHFTNPHHH